MEERFGLSEDRASERAWKVASPWHSLHQPRGQGQGCGHRELSGTYSWASLPVLKQLRKDHHGKARDMPGGHTESRGGRAMSTGGPHMLPLEGRLNPRARGHPKLSYESVVWK